MHSWKDADCLNPKTCTVCGKTEGSALGHKPAEDDGILKTDGIAPTEFDKKFSFEIKNGDTVVQTFAVSVNDYIGAQKNSATMGNLVKALYNYGLSNPE